MTLNEELPASSLVLPLLLKPILLQIEKKDTAVLQILKSSLCKVERIYPGFCYNLIVKLITKANLSININESLLRLQGNILDIDNAEFILSRTEEPFQDLNKKSLALKRILSRIPDEIMDRRAFLETIKEIASGIKKLLDIVSELTNYISTYEGKQVLEQRKRDFVKYSKKFSNSLKEFFKEGQ